MPAARWRKLVAITKQLPEIFSAYRKQLRADQRAALERRSE